LILQTYEIVGFNTNCTDTRDYGERLIPGGHAAIC
jgi:hypothetical protein